MTGNKKWPQFLATLTAVLAMFSSGIHYGWPSPSLPKLLSKNHPLNMTTDEGSFTVTIGSIGDIAGIFLYTNLADQIGRKVTLLLVAPLQLISMIMISLSSYGKSVLYVARFLGGMAEGACLTIIPIYIGEISEPKIRSVLLLLFTVAWNAGVVSINILGYYCTIEAASLISLISPLIFVMTFSSMSETPYYLLMKKQTEEANHSLQKLRRNKNVEKELEQLDRDVRRQMSERGRFFDLILIQSNRKASLIVISVTIISEFSGISSLTFYAQLFFTEAGDFIPEVWAASLMAAIQLIFTLLSCLILNLVGRRRLLLSSIAGCAFSLTSLSVFFLIKDYSSFDTSFFKWVPLAGMILLDSFFNVGLANISCCFCGELFSASVKTKAVCNVNIVYAGCVFVVTTVYQILHDRFGLGVPLLVFAVSQLVGFLFCWKFVPETRGKSLEQIQLEIKGLIDEKN